MNFPPRLSTGSARRPGARASGSVVALSTALACVVFLLTGCSRGPRNFINENDRLRAANMELERTVDELSATLQRRDAELDVLRQQVDGTSPLPGIAAPVLTTIRLDRYTGPVDTDGDGRDDVFRLYLNTLDQHGRAIPVEGVAVLTLVRLLDATDPQTLATHTYDGAQLRASYRSGFIGTHYTFELSLDDASLPSGRSDVAVRISLTDAATGAQHSATGAYVVTR